MFLPCRTHERFSVGRIFRVVKLWLNKGVYTARGRWGFWALGLRATQDIRTGRLCFLLPGSLLEQNREKGGYARARWAQHSCDTVADRTRVCTLARRLPSRFDRYYEYRSTRQFLLIVVKPCLYRTPGDNNVFLVNSLQFDPNPFPARYSPQVSKQN